MWLSWPASTKWPSWPMSAEVEAVKNMSGDSSPGLESTTKSKNSTSVQAAAFSKASRPNSNPARWLVVVASWVLILWLGWALFGASQREGLDKSSPVTHVELLAETVSSRTGTDPGGFAGVAFSQGELGL